MTRVFTLRKMLVAFVAMAMSWNVQGTVVTGDFENITSISDLTSGKYVVADATNGFVMLNEISGTYIKHATIPTVTNNKITNPDESIVWEINAHADGGFTISNGTNYVAYSGTGNSAYFETSVDAKARWNFSYDVVNSYFKVENVGTSGRWLQYNTNSPRFACYTGSQKYISLYKLADSCTKPQLTFTVSEVNKRKGDATFTYTATSAAGSPGTISYSSTNTDVATVDAASGTVTILRAGKTNIMASIVAEDAFCDGSAVYNLEVFPATGNEEDYILVTSAVGLEADAQYLIVGKKTTTVEDATVETYYAMGWQGDNNRTAVPVTVLVDKISVEPASEIFTGDVYYPYEITLKTADDDNWALYDVLNTKYLTPITGTSNWLRLSDDAVAWNLTVANDAVSTVAQVDETFERTNLRFNPGSDVNTPLFSCYGASSQNPVYFYKKSTQTGIAQPSLSLTVYTSDNTLFVNGVNQANISVYDITGKLISQTASTQIRLANKGIYIVKVNGQAFKVLNK
ncbi:MAG: T9SS type A sorting domain-containing protein [Candidatus Symbiothrix sp.]|jgi:hypothetical protein|nr:T9SS type A sorting domain-containing protein [Candidatus Symbiothrix sp.]